MAFMKIQGITVPVADPSSNRSMTSVGQRRRTARGHLRDPRHGLRTGMQFETKPLPSAEADAFAGLLGGRAQVWMFTDGLQSGRCLSLEPGYRLVRFDMSITGKFPGFPGVLTVDAGANGLIFVVDPQIEDDACWTVVTWIGGDLQALRADGQGFDDAGDPAAGILQAGGQTGIYLEVIDGRVFFFLDDGSAHNFSAIMVLPFLAPDDWFPQWAGSFDLGPAPILGAEGDFAEEAPAWVFSQTLPQPFVPLSEGGTWDVASRVVPFRVRLVPPKYLRDVGLPTSLVA